MSWMKRRKKGEENETINKGSYEKIG